MSFEDEIVEAVIGGVTVIALPQLESSVVAFLPPDTSEVTSMGRIEAPVDRMRVFETLGLELVAPFVHFTTYWPAPLVASTVPLAGGAGPLPQRT